MEPEVPGMEETKTSESHFASAAAFVEGGIQEACDDSCSICLEAFCESDPSTVTNCKHEFHLQCILEWCQRSSQCPMCWQPISLKDVSSQELLEGIERERNFRFKPSRNATIFHHPTLGDFELQHLPVGAIDTELEERIIQHLAAAASMGRAYNNTARREGHRSQGRPRFVVFSTHHNASPPVPPSSLSPQTTGLAPLTVATSPSSSSTYAGEESSQPDQVYSAASGSSVLASDPHGIFLNNRSSPTQSSPNRQDRAGPSESQSFSESLTSRLNAVSTRCKESISKSTRGWRERFFSRSAPIADMGSEVRREVHAGIATVSRMIERLDTKENNSSGGGILSVSDNPESNSAAPDISDSASAASSSSR